MLGFEIQFVFSVYSQISSCVHIYTHTLTKIVLAKICSFSRYYHLCIHIALSEVCKYKNVMLK